VIRLKAVFLQHVIFVSYVIFVGPLLVISSSCTLYLFNSKPTLMLFNSSTPLFVTLFYLLYFFGSLIAFKIKKENVVSRSSTRLSYVLWNYESMTFMIAAVTRLWWLLKNFSVLVFYAHSSLSYNTNVISIALDLMNHELTKHIGVDAYYNQT
jgi:hypothetical protein